MSEDGEENRVEATSENTENRVTRVPLTRDPGTRIRRLKCFSVVDKLIRDGTYLRKIALTIKVDYGELLDLSDKAVIEMLRNYRDWIYSDEAIIADAGQRPVVIRGDVDDPIYELRRLQQHFQHHEGRIEIDRENESGLGKLFSNTHREYLTLLAMGEKILNLKKKLGLIEPEKKTSTLVIGHGRTDLANVISNPESRQRVLNFVDSILGDDEFMDNVLSSQSQTEILGKKQKKKKKKKKKRTAKVRVVDRPSIEKAERAVAIKNRGKSQS